MYLFISVVMIGVLSVCFKMAQDSPYEAAGRSRAVLLNPSPDHKGPELTSVSMLKSFGGKKADWELSRFPLDGIVMQIGRNMDNGYLLVACVPPDICQIYLLHEKRDTGSVPELLKENVPEPLKENVPEPLKENVPEPLKENVPVKLVDRDVIEVRHPDSERPWKFEYHLEKWKG